MPASLPCSPVRHQAAGQIHGSLFQGKPEVIPPFLAVLHFASDFRLCQLKILHLVERFTEWHKRRCGLTDRHFLGSFNAIRMFLCDTGNQDRSERLCSLTIPIDLHAQSSDNSEIMTTELHRPQTDLEQALEQAMKPTRDPDQMRKALQAARASCEETRRKVGTLNVCVDLIREHRDQ